MKKIALYILAAAAILAGCSKKNIDTTPVNSEDAWMYDATLPVPIRFSANAPATKGAVINSLSDMVGKSFGFAVVNKNAADWPLDAGDIEMPQNAMATVNSVAQDATSVRFDFTGGTYYYPQNSWDKNTSSWDSFTFYGYHAHVATGEGFVTTDTTMYVRVNLGHTDVLWAEAEALDTELDGVTYEGFNSRYIRKTAKQPSMNFQHKTACLSFAAKTNNPTYALTGAGADVIRISKIELINTPVRGVFCIASNTTYIKAGEFFTGTYYPILDTLAVTDDEAGTDSELDVALTTTSQPVGTELFIYPNLESVLVRITYTTETPGSTSTSNQTYTTEYTLAPTISTGSVVDGFQAGYHYRYTLVVYSPEKVVIEATVEPYTSAFGDDKWKEVLPDKE